MQRAAKKLMQRLDKSYGTRLSTFKDPQRSSVSNKTSVFANGVNNVVVPRVALLRVVYHSFHGDSAGMRAFILGGLKEFAERHSHVAVEVVRAEKAAPPELQAVGTDGRVQRHVCYRLDHRSIADMAKYLVGLSLAGAPRLAPEVVDRLAGNSLDLDHSNSGADDGVISEWKRVRKNPRGSGGKAQLIDIKSSAELEFKPWHWKHVKGTDWRNPVAGRRYPVPVLSGGGAKGSVWSPFNAEQTFKP